jgi:hypothetical protein
VKINRLQITSELLKELGVEKGTDIIKLSIALTELSTFSKFNFGLAHETKLLKDKFSDNQDAYDILAVSNFTTMTTIQFMIVGKTIEAWNLIRTDERIHKNYFQKLDKEGQQIFGKLKEYFWDKEQDSNLNKLKKIRDKIGFHYDRNFDLFFTDDNDKPDFPEVRLYSNWETGGTTFLSDAYFGMVAGGIKMKEEDFDWLKLFKEFEQYLANLEILINKYILTILGDSIIYEKEMDIPDLKTGDTILNNHFWELPFLQNPPVEKQ